MVRSLHELRGGKGDNSYTNENNRWHQSICQRQGRPFHGQNWEISAIELSHLCWLFSSVQAFFLQTEKATVD